MREGLEDAVFLVIRAFAPVIRAFRSVFALIPAAGRAISGFWFRRSLSFRRRFAAVLLVLGLYAVFRLVALPGVPCEVSPAEECPPTDDAIGLVPADAYAYAHLTLDRDAGQVEQATELAKKFPDFAAIAQGTFTALGPGRELDLTIDVYPWLGDEVAATVVPGAAGTPQALLVAAVADQRGAGALLAKVGGPEPERRTYHDVELSIYSADLASAEVGEFLLLGSPDAVRSAIDTEDDGDSLGGAEQAEAVRDSLPADRLADVYVSKDGIEELLVGSGGFADQLDTFTDLGASEGVAAALVAHDDGLELDLTSALDPAAAKAAPSFFSAFPPFEPTLASRFSARTLALISVGDLSKTINSLLDQADAAFPGITEELDRLSAELARGGGIDIEEELLPLLQGEAAIGVAPARPVPYVTAVFDGVDEAKTREAVAQLAGPLIAAVNPAETGQAPTISGRRIEGAKVQSVRFSQALNLAYTVTDGQLIVATNPRGVEQALGGGSDLGGSDAYQAVTGTGSGISALVFLNLEGLVKLAEPRGLAEIVSDFRDDLARLKALGVEVRSSSESLDTELFLNIE